MPWFSSLAVTKVLTNRISLEHVANQTVQASGSGGQRPRARSTGWEAALSSLGRFTEDVGGGSFRHNRYGFQPSRFL